MLARDCFGYQKKEDGDEGAHRPNEYWPNYSTFKAGIIRSIPLAFGDTARHNGAHDRGSTKTLHFRWQAEKARASLALVPWGVRSVRDANFTFYFIDDESRSHFHCCAASAFQITVTSGLE